MLNLEITKSHGEWPLNEFFKLSVLPCIDFDGTLYYIVFDPREKDSVTGKAKQVICKNLGEVQALMQEIAYQAVDDYVQWFAKGE